MNGWAEPRVEGIEQSLANDVSWLALFMSLVPPLFDAPAYSYPYVIKYACGWHSERIRKRERAHFEITLKSIWIPLALSSDLKSSNSCLTTYILSSLATVSRLTMAPTQDRSTWTLPAEPHRRLQEQVSHRVLEVNKEWAVINLYRYLAVVWMNRPQQIPNCPPGLGKPSLNCQAELLKFTRISVES